MRQWILLLVASFILTGVFGSVSQAVFGWPSGANNRGPAASKADREQVAAETTEETTVTPEFTEETTTVPEIAEPTPSAEEDDGSGSRTTVTVSRVVDGDTIEISPAVDGIEDVRLIGVDTPETRDPDCGSQPYSDEATYFTESELEGEVVELEFDEDKLDRYGRLLAYVYLPGVIFDDMFNEILLDQGYAQVYTVPPNDKYEDRFERTQENARDLGLGIWMLLSEEQDALADRGNGIGGGGCFNESDLFEIPQQENEPDDSFTPLPDPEPQPQPEQAPTPAPSGDFDCSDFSSKAEAQQFLLPGDPYGLDRDGDGQACDSLR